MDELDINVESIARRFEQSAELIRRCGPLLAGRIAQATELIVQSCRAGGAVLVFGNGGSAADAQHIAGELVGRFLLNRPALRAVALTTDTSVLTAVGNDFDFASVYARQVEALARPGDVVWGISTSGNAPNVLAGLVRARELGARTILLSGQGGGAGAAHADILLDVPAAHTPLIQETHVVIYHVICQQVEAALAQP